MKIRGPAGVGGAEPVQNAGPARAKAVQGASTASHVDRVEISEMALFLDKISRLPDIRREKVEAVREQIARGSYETPEKMEKAVENLMKELW
jgi:negative regulator of flagellin synthesis FlgM